MIVRTRLRPTAAAAVLVSLPIALASGVGLATADDLAKRLTASSRSDADKARDVGRKPAEVVTFLGVEPGMTVIDLIAASGWYSEVLSVAVGPRGKVYAQNPAFVLQFRDGANEKAISARLADGRLPNVERLDKEIGDLGLAPGSIAVAITAQNFHDIYNGRGPEAAAGFLAAAKSILKPGGVLGIIDHAGNPRADNEQLHRIHVDKVEQAAREAGFEVEGKSDALHNPDDDHKKNVFDPTIRGKTDRFVLKLRKPKS